MGKGGEKSKAGGEAIVSGNDWDATVLSKQDEFIGKMGKRR